MVDGSLVSAILFFFANTSSTKQWEEPESNRAMNGQACSDMEADVRERRKEFGEREVEFNCITSAVLSLFGQLFNSTVGGIAPCIPNQSILHDFIYHKTYGGTSSLGILRNIRVLTPSSNNTKYPGCSYEAISIYSKEFH